jgi:hypothetical protein
MDWSKGRSAIEGMLPEAPVKVTLNLHGSADRAPRRGAGSIGIRRVRAQAGSQIVTSRPGFAEFVGMKTLRSGWPDPAGWSIQI